MLGKGFSRNPMQELIDFSTGNFFVDDWLPTGGQNSVSHPIKRKCFTFLNNQNCLALNTLCLFYGIIFIDREPV